MSTPQIRVPAQFPVTVEGQGGIDVTRSSGRWVVKPNFSKLAAIPGSSLGDPSLKQIWVFDPITGVYNVLTLDGLGDALYTTSSTTPNTIGAGSKTFTVDANKDFTVGDFLLATSNANPTVNYMIGQVTAYSGTSLTLNITAPFGSGTLSDWTIRLSGLGATGASYAGTSTTSLLIGTGSKVFTTQANLAYVVGSRVRAASNAGPSNWMEGVVTAYAGTSLTVNVDKTNGAGTFADWNLSIAGQPGAGDLSSANNLSDLSNITTARTNLGIPKVIAPFNHAMFGGI